jgi:hypothetical protein
VVDAVRWMGEGNCAEVFAFLGEEHPDEELDHSSIYVPWGSGRTMAYPGDWIVRHATGVFDVIAHGVFSRDFESFESVKT